MNEEPITAQIRPAARLVGVSETTLKKWIRQGLLPVSRIGGVRLVRIDDLNDLVERHQKAPGT
jgi:excisionase family DNA binding protein